MGWVWSGTAVVIFVLLLLWRRRRASTARAEIRQRLEEFLQRQRAGLTVGVAGSRTLELRAGGERLATVDLDRLAAAAAGRSETAGERLLRSLTDTAAARPRPLARPYELKRDGLRTLPRLAGEGLALVTPQPPPALAAPPEAAGLSLLFVVEGESGLAYLSDEHLERNGIDVRDLLNIGLAVLRQRFDPEATRRVLQAPELGRLEPPDGCGGSRVLLLADNLEDGEIAFAAAPTPARLLFAGERAVVEAALAAAENPPEPLPPILFEVSRSGLRAL